MAEGKRSRLVYCQALMAGLKAATGQPENLSKVYDVSQDEIPAAFLEWPQEAFRRHSPHDPEKQESAEALTLAFVHQASPDIKRKLQRPECLGKRNERVSCSGRERELWKGKCP